MLGRCCRQWPSINSELFVHVSFVTYLKQSYIGLKLAHGLQRWVNMELKLAHRLRCWANINSILDLHLMFATLVVPRKIESDSIFLGCTCCRQNSVYLMFNPPPPLYIRYVGSSLYNQQGLTPPPPPILILYLKTFSLSEYTRYILYIYRRPAIKMYYSFLYNLGAEICKY